MLPREVKLVPFLLQLRLCAASSLRHDSIRYCCMVPFGGLSVREYIGLLHGSDSRVEPFSSLGGSPCTPAGAFSQMVDILRTELKKFSNDGSPTKQHSI